MFENDDLPIEALVARNLGDNDWMELIPPGNTGCSRKATVEVECDHLEREPNIDKFTPNQLHAVRYA